MNIVETDLAGVLIFEPRVFGDSRGFFVETFRQNSYRDAGLPDFVQSNHSRSRKGVLRGLHWQMQQSQGKLVRVARGKVFDVAVDVRRGSPTFGQWAGTILDDETHRQFYVPENFAHGFLVLSDTADFIYECTDYYHPDSEQSLRWDDADVGIDWQLDLLGDTAVKLSDKDRNASALNELTDTQLPEFRS